jgi:hypothetical protein
MAAVLGMRGTGSFDSDVRPKNYREGENKKNAFTLPSTDH